MKEKKAVLKEKLESGETAIVLPVTALKCVEPTTDEVPELAEGDLVPIVQATDSAHLKAIKASALLKDVSDTAKMAKETADAASQAAQGAEELINTAIEQIQEAQTAAEQAQETASSASAAAQQATEAAQKAQTAAGEAASSCEKKPFTISVESWSQLETPRSGYQYSAEITDETVTANDGANIDFGIDCYGAAVNAEVAGAVETSEGKITIYAKSTPKSELSGTYSVEKEVIK